MNPSPEKQSAQDRAKEKLSKDYTRPREVPLLFGKAFILGAADVVPGVSGGTMALILGIYKRMLNAIKSVDVTAIRQLLTFQLAAVFARVHWRFGITLGLGIFSALVFFTRVVPLPVYMYSDPELIYGLFFGLIAGSIVLLLLALGQFNWKIGLAIAAGTLIGFQIVTLVPTDTPDHPLFLILTGMLSISALVLPGISGSFILLILRKYDTILGSIGMLGGPQTVEALFILVPFGIGVVFGLGAFARILSWLLDRYYVVTLCILIGFMAGSLYIIWPFQERTFVPSERPQLVSVDSGLARMAAESEPTLRAPQYLVLGEVVNPDAPEAEQEVEVIVVKNQLIASVPFVPQLAQAETDERLSAGRSAVFRGYSMMLTGLAAVLLLGFVSRKMGGDTL